MGNYSYLKMVVNNANGCRINWDKANTAKLFKHWLMEDVYKLKDERPETLADMAKKWDDTKFVGYLDNDYIESLMEFCRILEPCDTFPRLYYDYEGYDQLWYLEFYPGTEKILYGIFEFTNILKHRIPKHPEEIKSNVTSAEYAEWERIYETARHEVIESVIFMDGWKVNQLKPMMLSSSQMIEKYLTLMGKGYRIV